MHHLAAAYVFAVPFVMVVAASTSARGQEPSEALPVPEAVDAEPTVDVASPVSPPTPTPNPADTGPVAILPPVEDCVEISPPPHAAIVPQVRAPAPPPPLPRLQLAVGFVLGPHASGEAGCQSSENFNGCQQAGNFLGGGATIELRAQLYKFLYLHGRGLLVANLRRQPHAVHRGLAGGGLGLGAYSRLAFVRAEYMLVPTLGPDTYVPPFYDKPEGRDRYGLHAGMLSAGVHPYVSPRVALEFWGGLVVGPSSQRRSLSEEVAVDRVLVSFLLNVGLVFDVVLARGYTPPARTPRRQPRQW